jgi:hypothetical protein
MPIEKTTRQLSVTSTWRARDVWHVNIKIQNRSDVGLTINHHCHSFASFSALYTPTRPHLMQTIHFHGMAVSLKAVSNGSAAGNDIDAVILPERNREGED